MSRSVPAVSPTIATPVRGYALEKDTKVGQHLQVYNTEDMVQIFGGSVWLAAQANRTFSKTTNLNVTEHLPKDKKGPIISHSAMHSSVAVWEKGIWPSVKK